MLNMSSMLNILLYKVENRLGMVYNVCDRKIFLFIQRDILHDIVQLHRGYLTVCIIYKLIVELISFNL